MAGQADLQEYSVTIATEQYPVYIVNQDAFDTSFGKTTGTVSGLRGLNCFISNDGEDSPDYS